MSDNDKPTEPSTILNESWERFAQEFSSIRATAPLKFARMAFFAGAQSFCAAAAALDETDDALAEEQFGSLFAELEQAIEELKV